MGKDPAFLFYSSDFLIGTAFFTNEQIGKYIKLLCYQHQIGRLSKDYVDEICKGDEKVLSKFEIDKQGFYFNKRLEEESEKRKLYSKSRSENRSRHNKQKTYKKSHMKNICNSYVKHMENENEDVNVVNNKERIVKENHFDFEALWSKYPKKLGRNSAERRFKKDIATEKDYADIQTALNKFLESSICKGDPQYIPHGSTWFNNWRDWVNYVDPKAVVSEQDQILAKFGLKGK